MLRRLLEGLERLGSRIFPDDHLKMTVILPRYDSRVIPDALDPWVQRLRSAMLHDPSHHLPWRERRAFYEALGDQAAALRLRGWLAILSAQRALPVVLIRTPWDPQPLQNLDAAIRYLRGEAYPLPDHDSLPAGLVLQASYDAASEGYDLFTDHYHADGSRACAATYKALLEATGQLDRFKGVQHLYLEDGTTSFRGGIGLRDDQIMGTDEDWSVLAAVGDAAGAAAVALSCTSESSTCGPQKLRAFWMWWLDEALPRACQIARYQSA